MGDNKVNDTERLKFFSTFQNSTESELQYILENSKFVQYKSKQTILPLNSNDASTLLLWDGDVALKAVDGAVRQLTAFSEKSNTPLAQLRPSRYEIRAISSVKILQIDPQVITEASHQTDIEEETYSIDETSMEDHSEDEQIVYDLIMDLQSEHIELPSLPDIATKIRQVVEDDNAGAQEIAGVIKLDPAITTKMIKAANSAMYQRRALAENCQAAVVGLGTKRTVQLVVSYTMKELFSTTSQLLKKRMKLLWEHSIEVAATCFVLAKITPGFDPEEALLAGLIHDIGVIAILNKAEDYPNLAANEQQLDKVIKKMHAYLSGSIMRKWGFNNAFIEAGEEAEYWERDKTEKPDLCDLVNMAHLHLYIKSPMKNKDDVPQIDKVPAFKKMALGQLSPKLSLQVLHESEDQIEEMKRLLEI